MCAKKRSRATQGRADKKYCQLEEMKKNVNAGMLFRRLFGLANVWRVMGMTRSISAHTDDTRMSQATSCARGLEQTENKNVERGETIETTLIKECMPLCACMSFIARLYVPRIACHA